jgi:hypothetical protein
MFAKVGDAIEILARGMRGSQGGRSLVPGQALVEGFVCFREANHDELIEWLVD